jgi:multisubunit Na+/H+ antiporter MnhG subunit
LGKTLIIAKLLRIIILLIGSLLALLMAVPPQRRPNAMTHIDSATTQNQIQKSLVPMLRTWTHSIGWTVLLSAVLAVLFAMLCDGCAGLR